MKSITCAVLVAALFLSACASSVMGNFVGQPLQSAMVKYGPPANVFDMPDGRRAFQWSMSQDFVLPGSSSTTTNVYAPPGAFATAVSNTSYQPSQAFTQRCLYTMYARFDDKGQAWTFVGYEKPNMACE